MAINRRSVQKLLGAATLAARDIEDSRRRVGIVNETEKTDSSVGRADRRLVTEQEIRDRAYQIYQERNRSGGSGDPITDWLRAETELNNGNKTEGTEPIRLHTLSGTGSANT
jgi:Protein of unknown function (DUF2934)